MSRMVLVAGTRPEFIKLHPLALALVSRGADTVVITTGQHHTQLMRDTFFDNLEWPCLVEALSPGPPGATSFIAHVLCQLPIFLGPGDTVVVEGDTNSVLAAALVANKMELPLAHVEAGLRSFDLRMPEEHNRRMVDHISTILFAPTAVDGQHLLNEGCLGRIVVVGNTVLDAVRQNAPEMPRLRGSGYVLLTLHRKENVDDPAFMEEVVNLLDTTPISWCWPIHPRTRDRLMAMGLWDRIAQMNHVSVCDPMDYLAFLAAMRHARVIVTDSGGIQEEATAPEIMRPVVVFRKSTEREAAVKAGYSVLCKPGAAARRWIMDTSWFDPRGPSPFGDGHAADKIAEHLLL